MKNFFLITFLCVGFSIFGQNEPPKMPKYVAKNAAGIFFYNIIEATEKVKFKSNEKDVIPVFTKELKNYNSIIKKISFLNTPKLMEVELTINSMGEQIYKNQDLADRVKGMITEVVLPVRDSVLNKEEALNKKMETILSKRSFKRWIRYQNKQKEKLIPEQPQNNQNRATNNSMMMRRNRMGMGGRRF